MKMGIGVQELTRELAEQLGYRGQSGLVVTEVQEGSPAANAGVESGSLILAVNRTKVKDLNAFYKELSADAKDGSVLLRLRQNGDAIFVVIHLKE